MRRLRPSAAMLVAIAALVFALGGSAWAAQQYLITSKKQIAPSVLKQLNANRSGTPASWMGEVDNGSEFAVGSAPLADTSAPSASYSDAGVKVDVGSARKLSKTSLAYSGTGPLAENVWIGDGPQASVPGVYPLKSVDFCYGIGTTSHPTKFSMQSDCGSYSGDTLNITQIAADFPGFEAYAWVGVTSSGSAVSGSVSKVGGKKLRANKFGVRVHSGATLVPFVQ